MLTVSRAAMQARSLQLASQILGDPHEICRSALWRLAQLQRSGGDAAAARTSLRRWQRAAEAAGLSAAPAAPLLTALETGEVAGGEPEAREVIGGEAGEVIGGEAESGESTGATASRRR